MHAVSSSTPRDDSVLAPDVDPTAQSAPGDREHPRPDLTRTAEVLETPEVRSVALTLLLVLALLYTLYFARDFVLPIALAVLLKLLLSPVVRALNRVRIVPPIGAALVLVAVLLIVGGAVYQLSEPAQAWMAKAPQELATVRAKLGSLRSPVEQVSRTAAQVERATNVAGGTNAREVVVKGPSLLSRIFGTTERLLAGALEVIILLYFLLAGGDLFLQKLVKVLPQFGDKKKAVEIARETETAVSTYLVTVAAVNIGEGAVVAGVMALLGLPNPVLWGVLAALLEFIPYVGATVMIGILTLAGLTTFPSVAHALLAPASYLAINVLQANLVSPLLLGRRLTLNPVAIFVGLAFWWWVWGVVGAFIAVPLLATFKIFCDHIETLAPIGEFLGKRDEAERRVMVRTAS
ncbi:MAG TPA: AI-2E family transporter [Gemmatimonadaceae bacterium]|nr:AI-2E family transporter [Gemmatimonadaceae bacterium]